MANFEGAVSEFMRSPVHKADVTDSLTDIYARLGKLRISSLPVMKGDELVGVISRSDLLRVGRREAGTGSAAKVLAFPAATVGDEMTEGAFTVRPDDTLSSAAGIMIKKYVHRVYVVDDTGLVGVLSTYDLICAVRDKAVNHPINEHMSKPVFTVRAEEPVSVATDRLARAHITGLVVLEDDWPVGVFRQVEALGSRSLPRETRTDEMMDPAMLCMPDTTKLGRAAQQMASMRARRIIVVRKRQVEGILSGLDFARFVAR